MDDHYTVTRTSTPDTITKDITSYYPDAEKLSAPILPKSTDSLCQEARLYRSNSSMTFNLGVVLTFASIGCLVAGVTVASAGIGVLALGVLLTAYYLHRKTKMLHSQSENTPKLNSEQTGRKTLEVNESAVLTLSDTPNRTVVVVLLDPVTVPKFEMSAAALAEEAELQKNNELRVQEEKRSKDEAEAKILLEKQRKENDQRRMIDDTNARAEEIRASLEAEAKKVNDFLNLSPTEMYTHLKSLDERSREELFDAMTPDQTIDFLNKKLTPKTQNLLISDKIFNTKNFVKRDIIDDSDDDSDSDNELYEIPLAPELSEEDKESIVKRSLIVDSDDDRDLPEVHGLTKFK